MRPNWAFMTMSLHLSWEEWQVNWVRRSLRRIKEIKWFMYAHEFPSQIYGWFSFTQGWWHLCRIVCCTLPKTPKGFLTVAGIFLNGDKAFYFPSWKHWGEVRIDHSHAKVWKHLCECYRVWQEGQRETRENSKVGSWVMEGNRRYGVRGLKVSLNLHLSHGSVQLGHMWPPALGHQPYHEILKDFIYVREEVRSWQFLA